MFSLITARDWRDSIKRSRAQRNEVSEQIKQHMSTNNDGWILMSERKPTQFPVWLYDSKAIDGFKIFLHCNGTLYAGATHWSPADIPAPPMEKTQYDKDVEAFNDCCYMPSSREGWFAALAYERAEVAKMLPPKTVHGDMSDHVAAIEAIRARCGGGK